MTLLILTAALAALTFSAPEPVIGSRVRRPARLFVAGEYPDKGVSITVADLHGIVANFNADAAADFRRDSAGDQSERGPTAAVPVPVKIEHSDTPLDPLGEVAALYVEGSELFGVLSFSPGMDAHIRERGVEHLSIALVRVEDGTYRLKETSLVFAPRVASAGFLTTEAARSRAAQFAAAGKVTPAMRQSVERLLSAPPLVTFSDGSQLSVAREVEALLAALPVAQPRGSAASVSSGFARPVSGPSAAVAAFAARFGVDPGAVHANLIAAGRNV